MKNPTLILLHGALGSASTMEPIMQAIPEGYEIKNFELNGHGKKSATQMSETPEEMVQEIIRFIDALDAPRIHLFGYSMGGYLATLLAANRPQNICSVFTLGTKWKWDPEMAASEQNKLKPERILEKVPKYAAYLESLHGSNWPQVVNQTAKVIGNIGQKPLDKNTFEQIHLPVFLALGDNDLLVTSEETALTQNAIQGSRMQIISDMPHRFEDGNMSNLIQTWFEFATTVECPAL